MAAVRCHRSHAGIDAAKRGLIDDEMVRHRQRWRKKVLPLVRETGKTRSSAARAASKRLVAEEVNYEETQFIRSRRIMPKKHFKAYRAFWEKQDSESASSDFEALLVAQGHAYCEDGEDRVALSDHDTERVTQGERVQTTSRGDSTPAPLGSSSSGRRREDDQDRRRPDSGRERRRDRSHRDGGGASTSAANSKDRRSRTEGEPRESRPRSRTRNRRERSHGRRRSPPGRCASSALWQSRLLCSDFWARGFVRQHGGPSLFRGSGSDVCPSPT